MTSGSNDLHMPAGYHLRVNWISRGAIVIGGALYLAGCAPHPCSALQGSGRYRVTLHEPYTEQGPFTYMSTLSKHVGETRCSGPFGAGTGAQLEFRTTGTFAKHDNGTCTLVTAELTATSAGAVVLGPSSNAFALLQVHALNAYFFGAHLVEVDGCRGTLAFEVLPGLAPDGLFSAPVPGQYPPAVLYRLFVPESGDAGPTCAICDDAFVAELERVVE